MRQVLLTERDRTDRRIEALITKYQVLRRVPAETMAKKLGVSMPTWYRRKKCGTELTVGQLTRLRDVLQIPMAELIDAIGGDGQ